MLRSAARAALFPNISLTGLLGLASSSLGGLFDGGSFGWSASADATYPIFRAGAGKATVRLTEAQRDAPSQTIKSDTDRFREVSDALAPGHGGDGLRARAQNDSAPTTNWPNPLSRRHRRFS
jgi:multidrug efflux system outer membrane protein